MAIDAQLVVVPDARKRPSFFRNRRNARAGKHNVSGVQMKPIKGLMPVLLWFGVLAATVGVVFFVTVYVLAVSKGVWLGPWSWSPDQIILVIFAAVIGAGVEIVLLVWNILGIPATVPVGSAGILVVLGERKKDHLLTEGLYWIPPFSSILHCDCREQQLPLPSNEVLSSDNVPIRFKGQLQTRITDPYKYSDVIDPETTLLEQALDACRVQISSHTALEVALDEHLSDSISKRIVERAKGWGISVISSAISELRLPDEIEKYAQVIRLIRQQNPDISARVVLDALQADKGSIRKLVLESSSLEAAATTVVKALFGNR